MAETLIKDLDSKAHSDAWRSLSNILRATLVTLAVYAVVVAAFVIT